MKVASSAHLIEVQVILPFEGWPESCSHDTIDNQTPRKPTPFPGLRLYQDVVLYRDVLAVWIGQYGYFGIFSFLVLGIVGLPIPDEFLLFFSGYFVFKNVLGFGPTLAVAIA